MNRQHMLVFCIKEDEAGRKMSTTTSGHIDQSILGNAAAQLGNALGAIVRDRLKDKTQEGKRKATEAFTRDFAAGLKDQFGIGEGNDADSKQG
jgi:hypothetical protein